MILKFLLPDMQCVLLSAEVLYQARVSLFELTYRHFTKLKNICPYSFIKNPPLLLLFFSQHRKYFRNISCCFLIFMAKKYIILENCPAKNLTIPAIVLRLYTFISLYLIFMPNGFSALRRYCSTGSFRRFPFSGLMRGFFPGLFL